MTPSGNGEATGNPFSLDGNHEEESRREEREERRADQQAEGLRSLTEAVTKMATHQGRSTSVERDRRGGVIRVNPTLRWPFLEDGDVDIDAFLTSSSP